MFSKYHEDLLNEGQFLSRRWHCHLTRFKSYVKSGDSLENLIVTIPGLEQTNSESGVGVELSKLVNLALQTLNALLDHHSRQQQQLDGDQPSGSSLQQQALRAVICSSSGGPRWDF